VDDILCVHHDPGTPLAKLDEYFKMKEGSIQVPIFYLGAKLKKTVLPNGVVAWGHEIQKVCSVCSLLSRIFKITRWHSLVTISCRRRHMARLQGDTSLSLMIVLSWTLQEQTSIIQRLGFCAGVWSWDAFPSSLKCQCFLLTFCLPREGHLEAVFHVFSYLGLHHNAIVVFDTTYPSLDMGTLTKTDWKSIYGDVKEMIPSDAPVSRGKEVCW
jgi:hypothetical protein